MSIFREWGVQEEKGRLKEEMLYNLAASYVLVERMISPILAPFGLSPVKLNALMLIKHVGRSQGLSQVELGKKMIVSAGNITRLLDRLEREKLVERHELAEDRRIKRIKITTKGSHLLDKAWPVHLKAVEEVTAAMSEPQMTAANALLDGFRRKLSISLKEAAK